ncbi:hypothetical protein MKX01_041563 [Papaver californicum]|nr:hypothetical protein MKX01_041563 [Papaver californicum]
MTSQMIENHRENVEVYTRDEICKETSLQLLGEISLLKGLLPLDDLKEVGYNISTEFVWLRQENNRKYYFKSIVRSISYVKTFVENYKMKKLTRVKNKEILIWVSRYEMFIDDLLLDLVHHFLFAFEIEEKQGKKIEEVKA